MKASYFTFLFCLILSTSFAQLKSPSEFLGYELGTRFTRHDQVINYVNHVARYSDNAHTKTYGKTYEGRTLQLIYLSSTENINRLETVRKDHLRTIKFAEGSTVLDKEVGVVWLSYNVHGNESASAEAALKVLFTLVTEKQSWLEDMVIIIDPCVNPDGRDRYVNWYNQVKSTPYDKDPIANEHYEEWPSGRYNHYYFDLNRDWAWLTQIESQQRIPLYQQWMPHVHVDFHEQGVDSPYYFAPAVEPYHEIITDFQREFQTTIGKNHASYFDREGWLYFTKEVFDLLYPGYGDTYPTFHGAIGMTYEQGGSGRAGLGIINSIGDELTLIDRIEHHYITSLSTVEAAYQNKNKLVEEFKKYHQEPEAKYVTYALEGPIDKLNSLKDLLAVHHIPVFGINGKINLKGHDYHSKKIITKGLSSNAMIVKADGKNSRFIQSLLEPETNYSDSLTYDITSWSLPFAYGLKAIASKQSLKTIPYRHQTKINNLDSTAYAYAAERISLADGKFLAALINADIRVHYNKIPLTNGGKTWESGSIFIIRGYNTHLENLDEKVNAIAEATQQEVISLRTGFSSQGPDLGSGNLEHISNKKIGLLKNSNTSAMNYGEIWHFFEQVLHYPVTQIDLDRLTQQSLKEMDVLILPEGHYSLFNEADSTLSKWLINGGRIIAIGSALESFENSTYFGLNQKETEQSELEKMAPYADKERNEISSAIYGSIFNAKVDATHPLAAGYESNYYSLKKHERAYELLNDGVNVAYLGDKALPHAGFSGSKTIEKQTNSLLVGTENIGKGSVVYLVDNPLYRGFWENGKLWIINALFF